MLMDVPGFVLGRVDLVLFLGRAILCGRWERLCSRLDLFLSLGGVVFAVGCIFMTLSLKVLLKIGGSDLYLARLRMNQPLLGV